MKANLQHLLFWLILIAVPFLLLALVDHARGIRSDVELVYPAAQLIFPSSAFVFLRMKRRTACFFSLSIWMTAVAGYALLRTMGQPSELDIASAILDVFIIAALAYFMAAERRAARLEDAAA